MAVKDVCCELDGKMIIRVNTAVLPGWVGGCALLFILSRGLWNFMNSFYQPEFMRPIRLVLQTKLTPCTECAVKEHKVLLTFWQDAHFWHRLTIWNGIMLPQSAVLYHWNAEGPQACWLCSSWVLKGGAQTIVQVRRCSSILGCSSLRRTHFHSSQKGGHAICRPQGDEGVWLWKWAVHGWIIVWGRILRRERSTNQCRWELTKQYPGYKIVQLNFIMDIVVVVVFFFGGGGGGPRS